jgi:signal transduction histidine kinase/ActR/RegA family two-component response regulator
MGVRSIPNGGPANIAREDRVNDLCAGPVEADGEPEGAGELALRVALQASESRFRNLIEANADGVVVVRMDGIIAFANPAASILLGHRAEDLVGRMFGMPVVDGETTELDVPRDGGDLRVAELRVAKTQWDGAPALLASLRDVTDRKRLEEDLRHHVQQLTQADRLKDQFLAMLAHELRNPLAPILNAAHVMRLREDDPVVLGRMRDVVEHQATHIARLVDDLLDVSRFNSGKIQLRKEPVNLATVIAEAVEAARSTVKARGHSLTVEIAEEHLWLEADPTRIRQIFANLLDNAVKYTDPGGKIHLSVIRVGDEAVVSVRDNGIGISAEMLSKIFDLFAQADSSLDRSRGGLGIGLTLVKNLVTLHGGRIHAESAGTGHGCEVVVHFTLNAAVPAESAKTSCSSTLPHTLSRQVLIVDDNRASADSLASLLELSGHTTRVAYGGPDALELSTTFRPEFVLLDIGLPGMDGIEVARQLRQRVDFQEVVLVAMTGYGHEEIVQRSREAGFDHHLVKPLDLDALMLLLTSEPVTNTRRT